MRPHPDTALRLNAPEGRRREEAGVGGDPSFQLPVPQFRFGISPGSRVESAKCKIFRRDPIAFSGVGPVPTGRQPERGVRRQPGASPREQRSHPQRSPERACQDRGRRMSAGFGSPFQGSVVVYGFGSQDDALGCLRTPRWGWSLLRRWCANGGTRTRALVASALRSHSFSRRRAKKLCVRSCAVSGGCPRRSMKPYTAGQYPAHRRSSASWEAASSVPAAWRTSDQWVVRNRPATAGSTGRFNGSWLMEQRENRSNRSSAAVASEAGE